MKTIKFRPLRKNKKGMAVVASYQQWRRVKTSDYNKFVLIVDSMYREFSDSELVYNHKGENLFFYPWIPSEIPIYDYPNLNGLVPPYAINWGGSLTYNVRGLDCDGVPTFSHYTSLMIASFNSDIELFEPLTVSRVKKWLGWFLYQLKNNTLEIK